MARLLSLGALAACLAAMATTASAAPPPPPPPPQAFFLLSYDMLSRPTWPSSYRNYSLFIASPTHFSAELVQKVHADIPGSRVLAYFDSVSIPLKVGCSTGSPMGNNPVQRPLPDDPEGYFKELRATFNATWLIRDLGRGMEPICLYPGLAGYVLQQESADSIARFHAAVTKAEYGFDGLYVDMLTDLYWMADDPMANPMSKMNVSSGGFDCSGDGAADSVKELQTQWQAWRPYFVAKLREVFGEHSIIIGNSAGAMSLPGLNGVTIEMEWCGTDMGACMAAIEGSRAVAKQGGNQPIDVFWLTQAQQVPPAVQCELVYEMGSRFKDGSVYAGSDWFDGSHIVCNDTAATVATAAAAASSTSR